MKIKVDISSTAHATIMVDVPEEDIANFALEMEISPDEITMEDLQDLIYEKMTTPHICAQCSGWGNNNVSLELGDEWEIDKYDNTQAPEHRSIRKIA